MSVKRTQAQAVLAEEGLEHDAALLATLDSFLALRPAEVPPCSPELAKIFAAAAGAPGGPAADSVVSGTEASGVATAPLAVVRDLPRQDVPTAQLAVAPVVPLGRAAARKAEASARPRMVKRHRGAMIGVLVAVGMGVGGTAVAAAVGGQGWDWVGGDRAVISHVQHGSAHVPSPEDSPAAGDPGDVSTTQQPEDAQSGNSQGALTQGGGSGDTSSQDQNAQGQASDGPGRSGSDTERTRQGSGNQGGNSQGSGNQGSAGSRSGGQGSNH